MLPVASPHVIFRQLSDGAVLFSSSDEVYYGLNEVGAKIWTLLPPVSGSMDELCAAVAACYPGTDAAVIRSDIEELIAELLAHRLLIPNGGTHPNGHGENAARQVGGAESARVD